jgi:quercetin dioxygenase-like cupin family protein
MKSGLLALAFVMSVTGGVVMAQQSNPASTIVRKELLTAALAGRKDVARVEIKQIDFAPSQQTGLHRHPCPVVGYVAHGSIRFQVEGQPAQLLAAGSAFFEPAGAKVVRFDNASSDAPATFVAFYLLGPDDRQIIEML